MWTADQVIQWVEFIGLGEYTPNLRGAGIHGGLIALDDNFTYHDMVLALQVPQGEVSKTLI